MSRPRTNGEHPFAVIELRRRRRRWRAGPLATAHAQARAAAMMAACAAGVCRYADPHDARAGYAIAPGAGCAGYEAHTYAEDGGPVLRWQRCPRFRAWWRVEKGRLENRRAAAARAKRGGVATREWGEEA